MIGTQKTLLVAISALALAGCSNADGTSTSAFGSGEGSTGDEPTSGTGGSASESASNSGTGSSSTSPSSSGDTTDGPTTDGPTTGDTTDGPTTDGPTTDDSTTDDSTTDDSTTGDSTSGDGTTSSTGDESSSSTGDVPDTHQLYQGAFNGNDYEYGYMSIDILDITGGPADTDWTRWAMLNDNGSYRLYFMREDADDTIYQFVYNPATEDYEYGLGAAIDQLGISGAPADADMSSFAMLYGEDEFRLYAQSISDPLRVHQFAYNSATQSYEYGFDGAIPQIDVTLFPGATDFSGWGMLWEGDAYRFYSFSDSNHDALAQGSYNSGSGDYEWGFNSIPVIDIINFPADTNTDDFAMLHDGDDFRLYMMRE